MSRPHEWEELGAIEPAGEAVEAGWLPGDLRIRIRRCCRCGREELHCRGKWEVGHPGYRLRVPCNDTRPGE